MNFIKRICSSWCRERDGTTAIEFGFLALPFFFFAIAIVEVAMMYAANAVMTGATQDAVRAVRTGQVQVISDPDEAEEFFRTQICSHIAITLVDCDAIQFSVRVLPNFSGADTTTTVDEDGNLEDAEFDVGEAEDVVLVNVLYYHPLLTPIVGVMFADSPNNTKLLTATFVFQTEPYELEEDVI